MIEFFIFSACNASVLLTQYISVIVVVFYLYGLRLRLILIAPVPDHSLPLTFQFQFDCFLGKNNMKTCNILYREFFQLQKLKISLEKILIFQYFCSKH